MPDLRDGPFNEFAHHIAASGETANVYATHVKDRASGVCKECGQPLPCNMRTVADQALKILNRQRQPPPP